MIYLDNNVLGSLLAEDGCKTSVILCCLFLWPSFNMIEYPGLCLQAPNGLHFSLVPKSFSGCS